MTRIEWADKTWNPVTGCTKISEACSICYAERMSKRLAGRCGYPKDDPFAVTLHPDKLTEPLRWKRPSKIFVCSMGDLFHKDIETTQIDDIFAIMGLTYDGTTGRANRQRHTYMILTKRPERMQEYVWGLVKSDWEALRKRFYRTAWLLSEYHMGMRPANENASMLVAAWINDGMPGLWLGVTAENQQRADERIPILLQTPAAKRFVSVEPMLGSVDLRNLKYDNDILDALAGEYLSTDGSEQCVPWNKLDLAICGGETGPGARPSHPDWFRSLRDQCVAAGTAFNFKSWGDWAIDSSSFSGKHPDMANKLIKQYIVASTNRSQVGQEEWFAYDCEGEVTVLSRVGKKAAGRLLDGREWNEWPEVTP